MMKRIAGPYSEDHNSLFKDTKEGPMMMSNFVARITDELVYHDGTKTTTILKIVGLLDCGTDKEPEPLPEITVPASEFASCGWVADKWGMRPIVFPVPSVATELKTAIQLLSKPKKRDIYTHTGWTTVNGKPVYLAANGGMTADGMDASINVELPHELQKFKLVDAMPSADDFADTLRLVNLGPKHVTWPLLLATIRACVGPADFSVHLAGRTGTFKSEISSLFQSFYGTEMDARSLPASWNSTGNALEALAFRTKNALIVVDDFVPQGTSYNVRALQAKADTLIRAQGNQAGRARLTDISSHQATMYPRGIILSTGEDVPEGHSVRGRMMICELAPGSIDPAKLSAAQAVRPAYSRFLSSFVRWLCTEDIMPIVKDIARIERDKLLGIGHSRTPAIMGELMATADLLHHFASAHEMFPQDVLDDMKAKARAAITVAGHKQEEFLNSEDPAQTFCQVIRQLLGTNQAHVRTKSGGIPANPTKYGWLTREKLGEHAQHEARGPKIGWIDTLAGEFYFDPAAVGLIKKHSDGKLMVTPQTLAKRMVEAGLVVRTDSTRQRNTVRMTLENHPHQVMVLSLSEIMGSESEPGPMDGDDAFESEATA